MVAELSLPEQISSSLSAILAKTVIKPLTPVSAVYLSLNIG